MDGIDVIIRWLERRGLLVGDWMDLGPQGDSVHFVRIDGPGGSVCAEGTHRCEAYRRAMVELHKRYSVCTG